MTFDREKALRVAEGILQRQRTGPLTDHNLSKYVVDSMRQCVTDDPQTIDPVDLMKVIIGHMPGASIDRQQRLADRILAIVRPDPRIAKIEELLKDWDGYGHHGYTMQVREILRGDA